MMAWLSSLIPGTNAIKIASAVVITAVLAFGAGYIKGRNDGKAIAEVAPLKAAINDIRERNKDDADTQRLSNFDLCIRDLGRVPECDTLR